MAGVCFWLQAVMESILVKIQAFNRNGSDGVCDKAGADLAFLIRAGNLFRIFFQILGNYSNEASFLACPKFSNF